MLALAAHPRPRIRMAEAVNPGDFMRVRMAWRSSDRINGFNARGRLLEHDEAVRPAEDPAENDVRRWDGSDR